MNHPLTIKLGTIFLLILVLVAVVQVVTSTVSDRQRYLDAAKNNITRSWTGQQEILGPLLRIPYRLEWPSNTLDDNSPQQRQILTRQHVLYLVPKTLIKQVAVTTQIREKGIFAIPVYETEIKLEGLFEIDLAKTHPDLAGNEVKLEFGQPTLGIGIRDSRGLGAVGKLQWAARHQDFLPGSKLLYLHGGFHAPVDVDLKKKSEVTFSTHFNLRGLDQILIQPTARTFKLDMKANWPHPSFTGSFLPMSREISADGFSAEWLTHEFSSRVPNLIETCAAQDCVLNPDTAIGVAFIQPVDVYAKTHRSLKYAILFLCLVFAAFFVFETLKKLPIHPIQYGLVGLAISLFYLLLLSLSEHLQFGWAYIFGATCCIVLITAYLSSVLGSVTAASGFAFGLGTIYSLLYIIVSAEDLALMMGSLLLFVMLAILMLTTRNVDWYAIEFDVKRRRTDE